MDDLVRLVEAIDRAEPCLRVPDVQGIDTARRTVLMGELIRRRWINIGRLTVDGEPPAGEPLRLTEAGRAAMHEARHDDDLGNIRVATGDHAVVQVVGLGSAQSEGPARTDSAPVSFLRGLGRVTWTIILSAVGGLLTFAILLVVQNDGGDGPRGPSPVPDSPTVDTTSRGVELHVQNDFRAGAWTRTSPRDGEYYSREPAPANGHAWLANGTIVDADCWVVGDRYDLVLFSTRQTWTHWARLLDGSFLQMSLFSETTALESENVPGLARCD